MTINLYPEVKYAKNNLEQNDSWMLLPGRQRQQSLRYHSLALRNRAIYRRVKRNRSRIKLEMKFEMFANKGGTETKRNQKRGEINFDK